MGTGTKPSLTLGSGLQLHCGPSPWWAAKGGCVFLICGSAHSSIRELVTHHECWAVKGLVLWGTSSAQRFPPGSLSWPLSPFEIRAAFLQALSTVMVSSTIVHLHIIEVSTLPSSFKKVCQETQTTTAARELWGVKTLTQVQAPLGDPAVVLALLLCGWLEWVNLPVWALLSLATKWGLV